MDMAFLASSAAAARLVVLPRAGSTNDELAERVRTGSFSDWPEFSVVITDDQTSGKGRLGRVWSAPAGTMLAISVLLRPARAGILGAEAKGWLPLIAGLAMTRALTGLGAHAELKWPNDVLVEGRKVCGILSEALPGDAVILGSGVNLTLTEEQLPVPTATSMLLAGAETDPDAVLAAYLVELRALYGRFAGAGGDAESSGMQSDVAGACSTLGRSVRVQLPAADDLLGIAAELDSTGRLVIEASGRRTAVAAGDVTHLRY